LLEEIQFYFRTISQQRKIDLKESGSGTSEEEASRVYQDVIARLQEIRMLLGDRSAAKRDPKIEKGIAQSMMNMAAHRLSGNWNLQRVDQVPNMIRMKSASFDKNLSTLIHT